MDLAHLTTVMAGRGYCMGDKISAGSFAVVRNLREKSSATMYAMKLIDRAKAPEDFLKKFLPKELSVVKKLRHEYIIETKEIMTVGWFTCIIMEKAEGGDLLSFISQRGSLDEDTTRPLFAQMVLGLKYIHSQEIAHRDIKCENILLNKENVIKFADFGFARNVNNEMTGKRELSETYCGSAAYAAPEILKGSPYNPTMSDVWSLGVVLYIMVCGIMPFDDGNHSRLLRDQLEKRWTWHPDKKGRISVSLRRVVKAMLEPDLTQRANLVRISQSDFIGDFCKAGPATVLDVIRSQTSSSDELSSSDGSGSKKGSNDGWGLPEKSAASKPRSRTTMRKNSKGNKP